MIISAHMNFFDIEECGLYKHGSNEPNALAPAETFELIYQWVRGKPMEATIPWDPASTKSGSAKCYCHDYYKCEETGEYMFVLWKSESDSVGAIWGAQASAETGSSSVVEYVGNYRGRKVIWGRPCYYWVIPKLNTVISIKVDHSVCDSSLFQEWVTKCITNRVQHENKKRTVTESGQVRFEFSNNVDGARYGYRFGMYLRSLNTGNAQLQELARSVTHIIRRETIKLNDGIDDRPKWLKLFDTIPHLAAKAKAKTRQVEVRAEASPTAADIKGIIERFAREERKRSDWNNVGFATDKGKTVWVDKYRLHATVDLVRDSSTVFPAADLFDRVSKCRDKVLSGVIVDEAARRRSRKPIAGRGA